ncbi:hypothetical protein [Serratia fonticola]|uniref:hypothetical protein n=1 Tax=Serratia fonticola TaxID=47917 RepID=UPI00301C4C33
MKNTSVNENDHETPHNEGQYADPTEQHCQNIHTDSSLLPAVIFYSNGRGEKASDSGHVFIHRRVQAAAPWMECEKMATTRQNAALDSHGTLYPVTPHIHGF